MFSKTVSLISFFSRNLRQPASVMISERRPKLPIVNRNYFTHEQMNHEVEHHRVVMLSKYMQKYLITRKEAAKPTTEVPRGAFIKLSITSGAYIRAMLENAKKEYRAQNYINPIVKKSDMSLLLIIIILFLLLE